MSLAQKVLMPKDLYFIKYHPELKRFFGSEKAALIFPKLEYWSSRHPSGFWKFFEPCALHPQYRDEDSWEEETGFSRRVFLRAFALIGTHYKSKSDYLAQSDPFQGKMYVSYYDRKTNRTHFLRNHIKVEEFLASFWQRATKLSKTIKEKIQQCRSRNDHDGHSLAHASKENSLQRSTSSQQLPEPEPLSTSPNREKEGDKNIKVAEEMLTIWNQVTSNKQTLRPGLKIKLPLALLESFQGSLESWTDFCLKVASSKFLMGEAPNSKFKAYFAWLIKPDTIEAIHDKQYSLGDRQVNYYRRSRLSEGIFTREEVQGTDIWKAVCEQLCRRLGYATFKSWFKDLKLLNEETSRPLIYCPTRFMRDWIRAHYQGDLERIVKQILPHTTHLEISAGI